MIVGKEFNFLNKLNKIELFDIFLKGNMFNVSFIKSNKVNIELTNKNCNIYYSSMLKKEDLIPLLFEAYLLSYLVHVNQLELYYLYKDIIKKIIFLSRKVYIDDDLYKTYIKISENLKKLWLKNYQI